MKREKVQELNLGHTGKNRKKFFNMYRETESSRDKISLKKERTPDVDEDSERAKRLRKGPPSERDPKESREKESREKEATRSEKEIREKRRESPRESPRISPPPTISQLSSPRMSSSELKERGEETKELDRKRDNSSRRVREPLQTKETGVPSKRRKTDKSEDVLLRKEEETTELEKDKESIYREQSIKEKELRDRDIKDPLSKEKLNREKDRNRDREKSEKERERPKGQSKEMELSFQKDIKESPLQREIKERLPKEKEMDKEREIKEKETQRKERPEKLQ